MDMATCGREAGSRQTARRKTGDEKPDWLMWRFRVPPAAYRERNYALGPGFCCICGQPVYRFG